MSETSEPKPKDIAKDSAARHPSELDSSEHTKLESELRFQSLVLSQVNDAVVAIDLGERVTYLNQAAERLYGITGEEALGRPLREVYEYRWAGPEAEAEAYTALDRTGFWRGENVHVRRDGAELHVESAVSALRNEVGLVTGMLAVIRDITARKRAEAALRESEDRYRDLVENSHELMCTHDFDGRVLSVNRWAAEVLGYPLESLVGMNIREGLPPERRAEFDDYIQAIRRDGFAKGVMQVRTAAGEVRYWEYHNTLRVDGVEEPIVRGMAHDVTERRQALAREKEARREAEAANRLKDEFLATLSHELRTPLTSILGWAELLAVGGLDSGVQAQALETIARNAKAQTQLINDLLDVSRIITGKLRLNVRAVELGSVVEAAVDSVRPAADSKELTLQVLADPRLSLIQGDPDRLQQVMWNLLSNAVKFTPAGGRVEVELRRVGPQAVLRVTDTGQGIAPEFLPHVFDRFRQADQSPTRAHGGLGLGLSLVRHLVELHGGRVSVESGGEGRGATFTITLPLRGSHRRASSAADADPGDTPPTARPAGDDIDLGGLRVLVVDDDEDALVLMEMVLSRYGAEVMTAVSAVAALAVLGVFKPDLVICDIGMPQTDGYGLIRQVRALSPREGGEIPAVALTAYAGESDKRKALAAGFDAHVAKPVTPLELASTVAAVLKGGRDNLG